jgi:SecD/SecF fusion protein
MHFIATTAVLVAQAAVATELPWYREPWGQALITIAAVAGPTFVAWLLAKRLRAADMWGRIAAVLVAATCGSLVTWWNWPPRLGIDLKGGLILVYEVDAAKEAERRRAEGESEAGQVDLDKMDKLVNAVSRRVNPGGQKEVTVRRYGIDQIEVIVPEVDQAEVDLVKRIVSSGGALEFRIVANPRDARHQAAIEIARTAPGATVSLGGRPVARWVELDPLKMNPADPALVTRVAGDGRNEVLVVLDEDNVTGDLLGRCSPGFDESLQPCVKFTFNARGAERFGRLTSDNLPDPANRLESKLGIVLDGVLQSAPVIREAISSSGQISGGFKQQDVEVLVEVLNAGSLPAALVSEPISEQRISPQLGADTIQAGARAMALATVVVLLFMLAYYRFSGFVADLAVLLNIVLVLAVMISIKAAFTLAGLAGLVLSVGMAVDANVLIYERMREEIDRGAAVRMAIRNGFARAFSTILDSNLTTVITGLVLFAIGTDQLKGFAVTLVLGLMLNLFTAVFCSRVVFDLAERNGWLRRLNMARIFGQPNFRFVAWMPLALCLSGALILVGLAAAWARGPGLLDIDFTGGSSSCRARGSTRARSVGWWARTARGCPTWP